MAAERRGEGGSAVRSRLGCFWSLEAGGGGREAASFLPKKQPTSLFPLPFSEVEWGSWSSGKGRGRKETTSRKFAA